MKFKLKWYEIQIERKKIIHSAQLNGAERGEIFNLTQVLTSIGA